MSLTGLQWRDTGLVPQDGIIAWHGYDEVTSNNDTIDDLSPNARDLINASSPPVLTQNVINGYPAWYFDGTKNPLFFTGAISLRHTFILGSAQDASFSTYRGLLSGYTSGDVLVSEPSGTKFTDLGLGANYVYRKGGKVYANNDLQAPVNGQFALMEVQHPVGAQSLDGIQVGQQKTFTTRLWKGHFVEQVLYNRILTDAERMRLMFYFILKFNIETADMPLYFPSDDFLHIKRRRFYAEPPQWQKITDSYEFEDGGRTFNETAKQAPRRWKYEYEVVNTSGAGTPGEVFIFDEFYDLVRHSRPFFFADKYGKTWDNVRIEAYERTHAAHKPWRQNVKFSLIRYP